MAARTNLILKDRAATPVNHTFTPDGTDTNGVHLWSEKTGVPAGYNRFSAKMSQEGKRFRTKLKLTLPITTNQTINGVSTPVVQRISYAEVNFTFDALSSEQERKDAIGMISDSLLASQTQINDMIVALSDVY